jgi:hypothetical protein
MAWSSACVHHALFSVSGGLSAFFRQAGLALAVILGYCSKTVAGYDANAPPQQNKHLYL